MSSGFASSRRSGSACHQRRCVAPPVRYWRIVPGRRRSTSAKQVDRRPKSPTPGRIPAAKMIPVDARLDAGYPRGERARGWRTQVDRATPTGTAPGYRPDSRSTTTAAGAVTRPDLDGELAGEIGEALFAPLLPERSSHARERRRRRHAQGSRNFVDINQPAFRHRHESRLAIDEQRGIAPWSGHLVPPQAAESDPRPHRGDGCRRCRARAIAPP